MAWNTLSARFKAREKYQPAATARHAHAHTARRITDHNALRARLRRSAASSSPPQKIQRRSGEGARQGAAGGAAAAGARARFFTHKPAAAVRTRPRHHARRRPPPTRRRAAPGAARPGETGAQRARHTAGSGDVGGRERHGGRRGGAHPPTRCQRWFTVARHYIAQQHHAEKAVISGVYKEVINQHLTPVR